jgi:hypothetical protein
MMNFETCPYCCHRRKLLVDQFKPMILSGDNEWMQCGTCLNTFKLPDCDEIREIARQQRKNRYDQRSGNTKR